MSWNYEGWLETKLKASAKSLGLKISVKVEPEQLFSRRSALEPGTVYAVTKKGQSDITLGAVTQPYTIMILAEQNSMESAQVLFSSFAQAYNYHAETSGGTYSKHQYSSPVVLSNFNQVSYGYRSILYMSATLYLMEGLMDVRSISADNEEIEVLSFSPNYTMTANTQNAPVGQLATSVKSVASASIAMTVPLKDSAFVTKVLWIMAGVNDGNATFNIVFSVGDVDFDLDMKLASAQLSTAPDQIPSLMIGMIA